MNKKKSYQEDISDFKDYASKSQSTDLVHDFNEWVESKDFSEKDKEAIFKEIFNRKKPLLIPRLRIHFKNDPIALKELVNIILVAMEEGEDEDSVSRCQIEDQQKDGQEDKRVSKGGV